MNSENAPMRRLAEFLHHRLLWLLIAAYVLAGIVPAFGHHLRSASLGDIDLFGCPVSTSLPALLLALLLFNAGLGVEPGRLRALLSGPGMLIAGLLANLIVPTLFILGLSATLQLWHNPTEVQYILVGLALIASMPVAGSSTAWSQNANGDVALSLGLVLGSTFLSPVTTPATLHAVGWVADGTFAESLHHMAANGTSLFLVVFVLVPSLAGLMTCRVIGPGVVHNTKSGLKILNTATLLVLCYANASVALPQTIANPDWDFLAVMLIIVTGLCVLGFCAGVVLARCFGADDGRRASLMYGLGMTNNGTGLVLATTVLAHLPDVMLPVIFYNLVQHMVAAAFSSSFPADKNR